MSKPFLFMKNEPCELLVNMLFYLKWREPAGFTLDLNLVEVFDLGLRDYNLD